jgi:hypothetical protein
VFPDDLSVEELVGHFDASMERSSKGLNIVIRVLRLPQMHDLSGAATVKPLAFNITGTML